MHHTIQNIEDLRPSDIDLLTQLLSVHHIPHTESWLADQARLISTFPPSLLRPSSTFARLVIHLPFTSACAILCPTHKPLNPQLVRRIFLQITAEVTMRVRRLKSCKEQDLRPEVAEFLSSVQELNALWMAKKLYVDVYGSISRFQRIESGCEACILAVIGGDRRALVDLRSSVLGRKKKSRAQPRILPIIEGWVDWSGDGDQIRHVSQEVGKEVRHLRKKMQKERRERRETRKNRANATNHMPTLVAELAPTAIVEDACGDEEFGEGRVGGEEEADFEGSIISFYRDGVSSTNLPDRSTSQPDEMIHPAFRNSFTFLPETGTFQKRLSSPPPKRQTFYSQSTYSRDSGFAVSPTTRDEHRRLAERHSKTYCDLVGIPENSTFWEFDEMDSGE